MEHSSATSGGNIEEEDEGDNQNRANQTRRLTPAMDPGEVDFIIFWFDLASILVCFNDF